MGTGRLRELALALLSFAFVMPAVAETLEDVIVTATRSPAALVTYPGSATRVEAADAALVGSTHAAELVNRAAGAMIQRGSGQESLAALRSPVLTGAGACGSVLVLEDGIPIRPVGTCNVNELFEVNLDQAAAVEVLRGPGSVLYGSSAVHGIINVIPPAAADLPAFGASIEGGSDAWRRLRVVTSQDAADGGLGIAATATDDGGWRDMSGFEEQKLNAAWTRIRDAGTLKVSLSGSNLDQETAGFIEGEDAYRNRAIARSNPDPEAYRNATRCDSRPNTAVPGAASGAHTCAAPAWTSCSISCSASRSRRTARTAAG
jgi:outer membrane cobalamin receptor